MRRVLLRALVVAGGTVAGTAAAWALSTGSASAHPIAADPVAPVAAAAPSGLAAGDHVRRDARAGIRSDAGDGLRDHVRNAVRAAGRSGAPAGDGVGLPQAVPPGLRHVVRAVPRHPEAPRPSAGPLVRPMTSTPTGRVSAPSHPSPLPATAPASPPATDRLAGAVATPAGVLADLTAPSRWLPPEQGARPGLDQVAGSLRQTVTRFGDRLGDAAGGGLGREPASLVGHAAQLVPARTSGPTGATDARPTDWPATALAPAASDQAMDTATDSAPRPARASASAAGRRSARPAQPTSPLGPSGPPVVAPISGCACGQQGAGSSGGSAAATTTDATQLPATAVAHAQRPRSQREPAALGDQPGVTPD